MGAETIIQKIIDKAQSEIDKIEADAAARAAEAENKILADGKLKSDEISNSAKLQADSILSEATRQAQLNGRIAMLNTKRQVMQMVIDQACSKLASLDDESWLALYTRLISSVEISGDVTVLCNGEAEKRINASTLKLWSEIQKTKTGKDTEMVLEAKDSLQDGILLCGKVFDIDLSYKTICNEAFDRNEKAIAEVLFE